MAKMIRVRTPEFIRELNILGHIVRGKVDDRGPYIDISDYQEDEFRRQIQEMRDAEQFGVREEVPAGQGPKPEIETSLETGGQTQENLGGEQIPPDESMDKRTQGLNVADAAQLISSIGDVHELARVRVGEEAHPDYPGGRKGVVTYIDQRMADLVRAANQPHE